MLNVKTFLTENDMEKNYHSGIHRNYSKLILKVKLDDL